MERQHRSPVEQISPEDWENTPASVTRLVEVLLSSSTAAGQESHLIQFLDATPIGIAVHDATGQLTYINQAGRTILSIDRSYQVSTDQLSEVFQVYRQGTQELYPVESLPSTLALAGQVVGVDDLELHRRDQVIPLEVWASPIFDAQGKVTHTIATFQDISARRQLETERKRYEQEQLQREQSLNRVFQSIRNSLDLNTIFTTATAEASQLLKPLNCLVVQYLPEQGIWQHVAEFNHDPGSPSTIGLEIPDADNPFAAQLKQLQTVQVEDTSQVDDKSNWGLACHIPGAWLLIPLVIEGQLWGSFTVTAVQQPFTWNHNQVQLAQAVAAQLEVAIHQANLYQQLQMELVERCQTEAALRESEARFQSIAANIPGIIYGYRFCADGSDQFTYISSGFCEVYGFEPDEALQDSSIIWQMTHPDDLEQLKQSVIESYQTLQTWRCQYRVMTPVGQLKWLEGVSRPTRQPNGDVIWDGLIIDISDRKQVEVALQESEARYRLLAENMNDLVCLHDLEGHYLYVSPSCETLLGYRQDEMLGQIPFDFFHPDDQGRIYQEAFIPALSGEPRPITYRMRQKSGNYIWFETLTKAIFGQTGQIVQLQTTSRDVTERIQVQEQLKYDALHDALTGLPNRLLLMERLELAIHRAQRLPGYHFAVLFLDLDRFKIINDSLGHLAGDQLLTAVAEKLCSTLRDIDLVARLGGDEFVILLEEVKDIQEIIKFVDELFARLQIPILIAGCEVYITASIGIVFSDDKPAQASHLLRNADIAMYRAKAKGKDRYEIFNLEMHAQALNRLHLENDLRRAVERQELILHYQPILALDTGHIVGFETLVRWQHPIQGLKFPAEFIAMAEETGLITHIDIWAISMACHQLATWQAAFPGTKMKVSVNLSAHDLRRSNLLKDIDDILTQANIAGCYLCLEITESMLIEDIESTIKLLNQLKERGVQILIDDFGTGYSSLSYLHRLPVDSLKVDRSFVNQIQVDSRNAKIVETIASLSVSLGLDAIAEGIETQKQLKRLQKLGYKFGQGYLFSQPLTHEEVEILLGSQYCYNLR